MKRTSRITLVPAIAATSVGGMSTSLRAMEILMMKMRKSRAGLAAAAVLGAAVLAPSASFGYAVDAATGNNVTASGGDTLLFPIYTTAAGMVDGVATSASTSFSVTNTSSGSANASNLNNPHGGQTIAAKIRFREQEHSMDVLDFIVLLSPTDKFDFSVAAGKPTPVMTWNDNSCVVGPIQPPPNTPGSATFPPPNMPFVTTAAQMSVGHVEVLGMADVTNVCVNSNGSYGSTIGASGVCTIGQSLAAAATHAAGVPPNCALVALVFGSAANVNSINAANGAAISPWTDVDNVLVGRYVITIAGQGMEGASDAIAIQNSNFTDLIAGTTTPTVPGKITSQSASGCAIGAPTGTTNCTAHYAWDTHDWDHPQLGEIFHLAGFQSALTTATITGDWSNNPGNGVGVDWVLSFPEKYAYLDLTHTPGTAASTLANPGGTNTASCTADQWCLLYHPTAQGATVASDGLWTGGTSPVTGNTTNLCIDNNQIVAYDRDERSSGSILSVSPGFTSLFNVCNELIVFTLSTGSSAPIPSVIQTNNLLDPDVRQIIDFSGLSAVRGWAKLPLGWPSPLPTSTTPRPGDAVAGIIWTTRATGGPTLNDGSISELQKF